MGHYLDPVLMTLGSFGVDIFFVVSIVGKHCQKQTYFMLREVPFVTAVSNVWHVGRMDSEVED